MNVCVKKADIGLKNIAIYCRVSTDEQAREGVSLQEQQTRLKAYCQAMGWKNSIIRFVDDGYSAKNMERPALKELLRNVERGYIGKLMVTKLDRLSRRLLDLLTLIELFQQHGVSFVSTTESFDTDTPSGRLTLQVLGAVAEFERERIRERVIDNMAHAARSGKWLTQHPYGYRLEEKSLVVFEPEAEVVRRVFHMFLEDGLGYFSIAKRLNESGIPSRHNKQWSIRGVKLMLSNPAYIGTLVWNRIDSSSGNRAVRRKEDWITIENAHPPIIETAIWKAAQVKITQNTKVASRAKSSPHLLSGFLICGECGAAMSIGWTGWPNRYRVYRCSANKNKGVCDGSAYRADEVEEWFFAALCKLLKCVKPEPYSVKVQDTNEEQRVRFKQKVRNAKARYERQTQAFHSGLIGLDDLKKGKDELDCIVHEAQVLLEISSRSDMKELEQELNNFQIDFIKFLRSCSPEIAKSKLRELIQQAILKKSGELELVLNME